MTEQQHKDRVPYFWQIIFPLVMISLFANWFFESCHLFVVAGFTEQHFICVGCLLDFIMFCSPHLGITNISLVLFFWVSLCPFFVWNSGQFRMDLALFPFYAYLLIHIYIFLGLLHEGSKEEPIRIYTGMCYCGNYHKADCVCADSERRQLSELRAYWANYHRWFKPLISCQ